MAIFNSKTVASVQEPLEASFKVRHVDGHVLTQPESSISPILRGYIRL